MTGGATGPPTIAWVDDAIEVIDQTKLPHVETVRRCTTVDEVVDCIERLVIRGAPAIGVMGAYGVVLAARHCDPATDAAGFSDAVRRIREARPTAVNLATMVDRVVAVSTRPDELLAEAHAVRGEELTASVAMGNLGADLLLDLCGHRALRVMTICNTGGLATVERGTALAVIQTLYERGLLEEAIPLETRPLLQGGRLTTWELRRMGAPHRLIVDSAAASVLASGVIDAVVVGADRVAQNGDTANKIGTFSVALGARHAEVPFVVVAPESTIDQASADGSTIEIEVRHEAEVRSFGNVGVSPADTPAYNPAFDVTPVAFIEALVTDRRVVRFTEGQMI